MAFWSNTYFTAWFLKFCHTLHILKDELEHHVTKCEVNIVVPFSSLLWCSYCGGSSKRWCGEAGALLFLPFFSSFLPLYFLPLFVFLPLSQSVFLSFVLSLFLSFVVLLLVYLLVSLFLSSFRSPFFLSLQERLTPWQSRCPLRARAMRTRPCRQPANR